MKSEFIKLYESLSVLNESKQDTINFIKGIQTKGAYSESEANDGAQRFDNIKHYLKAPENDYYYGIKKNDIDIFRRAVFSCEHNLETKKLDKAKVAEGAKLVNETEHGKIYHITNYEASRVYGRDSQGCITGIGGGGNTYGNNYIEKGCTFYFCIAKQDYDPRGEDSKFAIMVHEDGRCYQVFDQQDSECSLDAIPYYEEIKIPKINLDNYENVEPRFCWNCSRVLGDGNDGVGLDGEDYCTDCWYEHYFECAGSCGDVYDRDEVYMGLDEEEYCYDCGAEKFYECPRCYDTVGLDDVHYDENGEGYCSDCGDEIQEENEMLDELENEDDEEE